MTASNPKDMSMVVAEGEVEGVTFHILRIPLSNPARYEWRILKGVRVERLASTYYDSIEAAIDAVMKILASDAIPVEYTEPTPQDFEALNALLYVGGLQQDITTFQEALEMYMGFQQGLPVMLAGRDKMAHDLEQITNDIKATRGAMSERVQNLIKMREVIVVQYQVLEQITTRNMETLFSFIDQFIKK